VNYEDKQFKFQQPSMLKIQSSVLSYKLAIESCYQHSTQRTTSIW